MAAAFTLIAALPLTDEIGFALIAVFAVLRWVRVRREQSVQPAPLPDGS